MLTARRDRNWLQLYYLSGSYVRGRWFVGGGTEKLVINLTQRRRKPKN